jgi:protein arginine kinase
MIRLGLALGLLRIERAHEIEQLMVDSRPAHLQKIAGKALSPEDRDVFRAEWVRSKLADLMKGPTL